MANFFDLKKGPIIVIILPDKIEAYFLPSNLKILNNKIIPIN